MSYDHDTHAPLPQEPQIAPILAARAPAVPRKRPAAPSPLSGILANLPQISPATGTKRKAPAVAAATTGSVAMAIAAAEESIHDPQNIASGILTYTLYWYISSYTLEIASYTMLVYNSG